MRTLGPGTIVEHGGAQILTTFADIDAIEFGVVFKDRTGTFWNEVDTVVTPSTIELAKMHFGDIDLLFSVYASQNLGFFGSMRAGYPLDIPKRNLSNVRQIAPKLLVPGSAGFRFTGALEWTNPFLFPISRDHFLADLQRVAPDIPAVNANSGDVFEIDSGKVTRLPAASPVARMIEDDTYSHRVRRHCGDSTARRSESARVRALGHPRKRVRLFRGDRGVPRIRWSARSARRRSSKAVGDVRARCALS